MPDSQQKKHATTLLDLIAELQSQGVQTEAELCRLITYLIRTGRVRLTGNFGSAEGAFQN